MPSSSSTMRILSVTPASPPGPEGRGNPGPPSSGVPAKSKISWGGSRPPPCGRRLGVGGNNSYPPHEIWGFRGDPGYGPAKPGLPAASNLCPPVSPQLHHLARKAGGTRVPPRPGSLRNRRFRGVGPDPLPAGADWELEGTTHIHPTKSGDFAGTPDKARQSRAYPRRQFTPTCFTPSSTTWPERQGEPTR